MMKNGGLEVTKQNLMTLKFRKNEKRRFFIKGKHWRMDAHVLVVIVDSVMKLYQTEGEECQVSAHYNGNMDLHDQKHVWIIIVYLYNYYQKYVLVTKYVTYYSVLTEYKLYYDLIQVFQDQIMV